MHKSPTSDPPVGVTPRWVDLAVVALSLLIVWPLLGRGYVLRADMVFTPRQWLLPDSVGLGTSAARAVPIDGLLALATGLLPGWVWQNLALVALTVLSGSGMARMSVLLMPSTVLSGWVQLCAATLYLWSPLFAQRLLIGQWTLLLTFAALPWLVIGLHTWVAGGSRGPALAILATAVCALAPGGGVISLVLGVCVLGAAHATARQDVRALLVWLALNAPWWLAGFVHVGTTSASSAQSLAAVEVFSARSDTFFGDSAFGVLASLFTSGAIWNSDAVLPTRGSLAWVVWTAVAAGLALLGWRAIGRAAIGQPHGNRLRYGLASAAALGWVVASLGALMPATLAALIDFNSGFGLLRDGQRWIVLWWIVLCPVVAVGISAVSAALTQRTGHEIGQGLVCAVICVPILLSPDLAWGAFGRLSSVDYPSDWAQVNSILQTNPTSGDVVSLPYQPYRQFGWNEDRAMLDPAPRYLDRTVVVSRDLTVESQPEAVGAPPTLTTIPGDDPRSAAVGEAMASGDRDLLNELGVEWLLIAKNTPGTLPDWVAAPGTTASVVVWDGPDLQLRRLEPAAANAPGWALHSVPVRVLFGVAWLLAALIVVAAVVRLWATTKPAD